VEVSRIPSLEIRDLNEYAITNQFTIPHQRLSQEAWALMSDEEATVFEKVMKVGKPLGDTRAFVERLRAVEGVGEFPPIIIAALRQVDLTAERLLPHELAQFDQRDWLRGKEISQPVRGRGAGVAWVVAGRVRGAVGGLVDEPARSSALPPPPLAAEMTSPGGDHHVQAAKVLGLAQEMADRLTAEAKAEADGMLADARTKSEQLLSEARTKSDSMVNEARSRAETMLNDARARAETVERQAREKASTLERDAQRKHSEVMGVIERDRAALEKKIDELRTFEREYRTRLKTYLESQLRELEGRGSAAPADGRVNANSNSGYTPTYVPRADAGS